MPTAKAGRHFFLELWILYIILFHALCLPLLSVEFGSMWNHVFHCRPKAESCQSFLLATLHKCVGFKTFAPVFIQQLSDFCRHLKFHSFRCNIYSNMLLILTVVHCRRFLMSWCVTIHVWLCNKDVIWQISKRMEHYEIHQIGIHCTVFSCHSVVILTIWSH